VRSSARTCGFSSTHNTTACSGGSRYSPTDVADLLDELRVARQLEGLGQVGLEPKGPPDPTHAGLRHPALAGHLPGRPVGGVGRGLLQGLDQHPLDLLVGDRSRCARPWLVGQPFQPVGQKACAPLGHRRPRDAQPLGDLGVGGAPPAQASTMRHRSASAWALLRRRDHRSSVARSSVDSTSGPAWDPAGGWGFGEASIPRTYQTANAIAAQDTSSTPLVCPDLRKQEANPTASPDEPFLFVQVSASTAASLREGEAR